jgi:hypothetical protein
MYTYTYAWTCAGTCVTIEQSTSWGGQNVIQDVPWAHYSTEPRITTHRDQARRRLEQTARLVLYVYIYTHTCVRVYKRPSGPLIIIYVNVIQWKLYQILENETYSNGLEECIYVGFQVSTWGNGFGVQVGVSTKAWMAEQWSAESQRPCVSKQLTMCVYMYVCFVDTKQYTHGKTACWSLLLSPGLIVHTLYTCAWMCTQRKENFFFDVSPDATCTFLFFFVYIQSAFVLCCATLLVLCECPCMNVCLYVTVCSWKCTHMWICNSSYMYAFLWIYML